MNSTSGAGWTAWKIPTTRLTGNTSAALTPSLGVAGVCTWTEHRKERSASFAGTPAYQTLAAALIERGFIDGQEVEEMFHRLSR
jgi:hypothetical protein